MFRLLAKLCLTAIVFICSASASEAAKRVALVIGNSAYSHAERLTNPLNDASKLAAKLKDIGFGTVTLKLDQSYNELRRSLRAFSKEAAGADIALLYFAGHGMEVGGTNYVIPTDAKLSHVDDVEYEAIELSKVIGALSRANKLKIVILDACRNNPFKASMATENTHRSMGRGLARVSPAGSDTLVAYAAKEGTIAADGDGEHSPYTRALLKHIGTGGLDVRLLFGRVRDDVLAATGRKQEPFTYGSLSGQRLALVPESAGSHTPSPAQRPVTSAVDREALFWASVQNSNSIQVLQTYLDRYPDGEFSALARAKIDNLKPKAIDTARLKPVPELPAEPSTPPAVQAPQLAAPAPAGWRYTCQDGSGAQQCGVISVAAGNGSPKQEAMKVTAVFSKSGKNVLIRILTPNGVYVPEGVLVSIDGHEIGRIQLTRCLPEACTAVAELTKSTLRKLKRGNDLRVVIHEGPGTEFAFNFSLNGFTRAISQLN